MRHGPSSVSRAGVKKIGILKETKIIKVPSHQGKMCSRQIVRVRANVHDARLEARGSVLNFDLSAFGAA
jgi:hypothetical protein